MHREIAAAALDLFLTQGFEATTVDQIAEAAGISRRSFFRYFATKEDVVVGDLVDRGRLVLEGLLERPVDEDPWESLAAALRAMAAATGSTEESALGIARLLHDEPSLRARHLEKHLAWQRLLVPEVARRLRVVDGEDAPRTEHRAAAIVACVLACLDTASDAWVRLDGAVSLEALWSEAVAAVRGVPARG